LHCQKDSGGTGTRGRARSGLGAARILLVAVALAASCRQAPSPPPAAASGAATTFNKDVAPILYGHCTSCHRPDPLTSGAGGITADVVCIGGAPFSLVDYRDAAAHAAEIATATSRRSMPPWPPEPGYGHFADERRLASAEIETLRQWAAGGAIEGDPSSKPAPPVWRDGWQLGQPDLVLRLPQPYTLNAEGTDVFRNFVIPVPLATTRYVRAVEFRSDNPRILHHATLGVDRTRNARLLDRADPEPGFAAMPDSEVQNVYGWSPGKAPAVEPAGLAWTLDKGSDLVIQLHLLPDRAPAATQPSVGLFFSDAPPARPSIAVKLESKAIDIQPGTRDYVAEDDYVLPVDVEAMTIYPHAHYLARTIRALARLPDGTTESLIWIKDWNFRQQDEYRYAAPVALPRGTTLTMQITYDNSADNPRNPSRPPRRVLWGPRSSDEMGVVWLKVVPVQAADAAILIRDAAVRALQADIRAAAMRVSADPADWVARGVLGARYLQAARPKEAVAELDEALRLRPDDADAHSNLGTALQLLGRTGEAMRHLREATRLAPANDRAHFNLGNVLNATGSADEALREFGAAIRINPDNADAHFNMALILGPRQRVEEATVHLRRALEINPQNAEAHRNLGVALALQGRPGEAMDELRTALAIRPDSAEARKMLDLLEQRSQPAGR
jgi:tetratricopeptide (TPR) repeat protein